MILNNETAHQVAKFLLQIKAIILKPNAPFVWSSGWHSPIYCDNRITLSHTEIRTFIRQYLVEGILANYGKPDVIAGVATGAIAHGALVAQELGLPFAYVRASSKGHGRQNLIEGHIENGQSVVVIEDLVSTGKSSLAAVKSLKDKGLIVRGMAAIFSYGFEQAKLSFEEANCELFTLGDYQTLINQALETKYISEDEIEILQKWHNNPSKWNVK